MTIRLEPIAVVRSPWREKFGIPRQSGLAREVVCHVELDRERVPAEALRGLEGVSHLWLITWFHGLDPAAPSRSRRRGATVRPPRLGGATRLGVLATRSPHRPNPIGLTLVRLLAIEAGHRLRIAGADLLDRTPVLDLKPHLPWAEQPQEARCAWAPSRPAPLEVRFEPAAEQALAAHRDPATLRTIIVESLRWDPRPAHQRRQAGREFAAAMLDVDVRFRVDDPNIVVTAIEG